ncbi:MAG: hypothetical protein H0W99_03145 [Acidobacteria bacterium]|jgi:hypothetical protein|nr:hypothetical protein [Acidobacteriota bacterium]
MLYPELENKLHQARQSLKRATSENIIELCKQYLVLLDEYRSKLYKLSGTSGISLWSQPFLSSEDIDKTRRVVRVAIENTTQERNRTATLLRSFIAISGYEAVETLNRRKYRGHDDWELRAGGVKFSGGIDADKMTIQEAVATTSLLRRAEYVAQNSASKGASRTVWQGFPLLNDREPLEKLHNDSL